MPDAAREFIEQEFSEMNPPPLYAALQHLRRLLEQNERLRSAIQKVLDDESANDGWGPDVTTVAWLKEALDEPK